MVFEFFYLFGLLAGFGLYALLSWIHSPLKHSVKVLVVAGAAAVVFLVSILVIGGFEGMPVGMGSAGLLTSAILLSFAGKVIWRKIIYAVVLLSAAAYILFQYTNEVNYWIVKKTHYSALTDAGDYIKRLQKDPAIRGYKTFPIAEGRQGLVLSLGGSMAGNTVEVLDVKESGYTTIIQIRTFYNQSGEPNPVIMIGLDRLQPEINVMDTDGTIYEKVK
ncbi:hypothetical protein [Paenibacillus mucilaginosus]|uniref:Uncharacterized protein n=1 Tax=Paenibacillus mucilaginosus (strain KNP414) TaxID=1036673 RepID=F8F6P3_PAEMK|nr:hypothetical protein [Paenibacillus mucilaginosus]AEI43559.1 hypothetical protein KNP414_05035 [Paenibacillus mucilaginosus KNP414]MCG7211903.1 hypothetical protein [Paenibacillus mucilaginosus]WDM25097.1 hypothetical protein KCX80_21805 [Paenibacillus mucilaginosus]